ncbi:hypothetical protein G9A89_007377 [Geosiphon pyriformis]|nr:hypothetical protein G9A89_007377 [Geosiphon pyriformis]
MTLTFGQLLFQSKQKKTELLGTYESEEKEEKEAKDQEFTYQNLITENPEIETPNIQIQQTPNNLNPNNHYQLVTNCTNTGTNSTTATAATYSTTAITTTTTDSTAITTITTTNSTAITTTSTTTTTTNHSTNVWLNDVKKAITANKWDDVKAMQAISYFLQDTTNSWYQSLVNKLQDFNAFKLAFLQYFSNNNSINRLANTFITIKQEENEAVTTYLECFHRNLRQIQAIQADYFTAPQILNQFIRDLCSSILQCICPMHLVNLQAAVTNTRDFEAAKLKANHAQAINLVMNGSSELDSKLKQFSDSINQKLEGYLANNYTIYQPLQQYNIQGNTNHFQNQSRPFSLTNQQWQQEIHVCHYCDKQGHLKINCSTILTNLLANNTTANILTIRISTSNLSTAATGNILITTATNYLSDIHSSNTTIKPSSDDIRQPQIKSHPKLEISNSCSSTDFQFIQPAVRIITNYLSLLVTPENAQPNNPETNQQSTLTSNILPVTISNDKSLVAIFPFEFEETTHVLLFSRATLDTKPITTMYINFEEEEKKPTWKAYQVSWTNTEHNELPPVPLWNNNNRKEKKKEELIWNSNQV